MLNEEGGKLRKFWESKKEYALKAYGQIIDLEASTNPIATYLYLHCKKNLFADSTLNPSDAAGKFIQSTVDAQAKLCEGSSDLSSHPDANDASHSNEELIDTLASCNKDVSQTSDASEEFANLSARLDEINKTFDSTNYHPVNTQIQALAFHPTDAATNVLNDFEYQAQLVCLQIFEAFIISIED